MRPGRLDPKTVALVLGLGVVVSFVLHVAWSGPVSIPLSRIVANVFRGDSGASDTTNLIVWRLRAPRACGALLAGALLGSGGCALQSLLRNRLAEPYLVGASGGSAAGGAVMVLLGLGSTLGGLGVVAGAVVGASLVLALVLSVGRSRLQLLLAGVVIGTMASALTTLLLYLAGNDTNRILAWLLGSTANLLWPQVGVLFLAWAIGSGLVWSQSRALNVVAVTEASASSIGVSLMPLSRLVLGVVGVMTAVSVGSVGMVSFVGLVAPLIGKFLVGPDMRKALPVSAMAGALLLVLADIGAQRLMPGREVPVGALTAVIGAPVLLAVMSRDRPSSP